MEGNPSNLAEGVANNNPPQRISKLEAEVQLFTQKRKVMELKVVNAIMTQNKKMHQQLQQQIELMDRKINELQIDVVNAQSQSQTSHGWNQAEKGFGAFNYEQRSPEQVQSLNNTSSSFQHNSNGDVYNPP